MANAQRSWPELDQISSYLAKIGFPISGSLAPASRQGITSFVAVSPGELAVKISIDPELEEDFLTERAAASVLIGSQVWTPRLLHWDDSRSEFPGIVAIWDYASGEPLASQTWQPERWNEMARDLGAQIAEWQNLTSPPHPHFDIPTHDSWEPSLERALREGRVLPRDEAWFRSYGTHLDTSLATEAPSVFLHNDLHSGNVMVTHAAKLAGIIDWGDAGFGDPVLDFHCLMAPLLPGLIEGYSAAGGSVDEAFAGRLMQAHFCRVVADFARPWTGDWLSWTGQVRWEALESFWDSRPGSIWRHWLPL
ncbi:MAG: aminoglycoside phosphotransferase family protein [Fimbriimonadaceae bacterium]|jgi:hypothetical protein|nr:aminoglycoside phosphotransferase family protein [Fimbriimonadaceae bacterium]